MSKSQWLFFKQIIAEDLYRYGCCISGRSLIKNYIFIPGFKYNFWMRLTDSLRKSSSFYRPFFYFCRFMLHRCSLRYGIGIAYNTRIGPGLYIGHYGGIIVHGDTVIGRDCNINHGVTIGMKYGGKNPGVPVIGDRVYLGPGCKVIGGIRLGNDVAIGANAVVVESVPDLGVVVGVPARIVSFKGSSEYVVNTNKGRYPVQG